MDGKVLISPGELSDLMKAEPVVLIDTRDPQSTPRLTSLVPSMCVRSSPTLLAQHRRAWQPFETPLRRLSVRRAYPARKRRLSMNSR